MGEEEKARVTVEDWLTYAQELVPVALNQARKVKGFPTRWKMIISRLAQIPSKLSDLSSHPCFSKNKLCKELLQSVSKALHESIQLSEICVEEKYLGKLQMQSDLDSLLGKLDLNLRDCSLLIKTGVLGETTVTTTTTTTGPSCGPKPNVKELLARLQMGPMESKHEALDAIVEVMKEDEKAVLSSLTRTNVCALVGLMTTSSPRIREKAGFVLCWLSESGSCDDWLVSEGALPCLIRLTAVSRERAGSALQRLSMGPETARAIVAHGGIGHLIELCSGDSSAVSRAAAVGALRNISAVSEETRQALSREGIVRVVLDLLSCDSVVLGTKEYAAECLQNLTASNEILRRTVIAEGGVRTLLAYLDGPLPQEPAMGALRNLVGSVPIEFLESLGFLPRVVHVLKSGSPGARQAAASAICRVCDSPEVKKTVGEAGPIPLLIDMLELKSYGAREVSAQALSSLMTVAQNAREVKRNDRSVPNLVQLLDPNPQNTAKKYAISCLLGLASSRKCRRMMVAYGAIGYLKKLREMEIPGAKKLLERLERGRLKSLLIIRKGGGF